MTDPELHDLLIKTSRTFALSIPVLPEPARAEVTLAYLLLRIADTFEDAHRWPKERRVQALNDLSDLLRVDQPERAAALASEWVLGHPIEHAGYVELLAASPRVLAAHHALGPASREVIARHVILTNEGMIRTVLRSSEAGQLRLDDLQDLRDYCYIVAGLVGELLTELYLLHWPSLVPVAAGLRQRARWFGEGLQLVNILKDAAADATEGRSFIPTAVGRPRVFALAREDLQLAAEYVQMLHRAGAPRGTLAFNALPLLLAWATLRRVEERGAGAKISRDDVFGIVARLDAALDRGEILVHEEALAT